MRITYVDHTSGKHQIDSMFKGLRDLGHSINKVKKFENTGALIWVDHLTENAINASRNVTDRPLILRLSAMELYKQKLDRIQWGNVSKLVVHGRHLKDYFLERFAYIPINDVVVIPLAIDTDKFNIRKGLVNNKIALVSEVHWRKGIQNIITALRVLPEGCKVHHIGKIVNWDCKNYVDWQLRLHGLSNRYVYEGELNPKDVNDWLEDKTYILHLSYTEGMPRAVGEAMSKGIKPLVFDYRGASEQWPDYTWEHLKQLGLLASNFHEKNHYRDFVVKNYSIPAVAEKVSQLCESTVRNT